MLKNISTEHKLYIFLGALLSVASLIPIWLVKYFPSQNGPAFLFIVHAFKEMNNPAYRYSEFFIRHLHNMPYLTYYTFLFSLSYIFPLVISQKIIMSLIAIIFPLSIFYFLKKIDPHKIIFAFPVYLMIYNYAFLRSYNGYMTALLLFFLFLGYWYKIKNNLTWKRILFLNSFLLLVYFSHITVVVFLIFIMIIILLLEGNKIGYILNHLLKIGIPTLVSTIYFIYFNHINSVWCLNEFEIFNWSYKTKDLYLRFLCPFSHIGKILSLIPFVIIVLIIAIKRKGILIDFFKKKKITIYNSPKNRHLIILLLTVFIYYLAPWKFIGWHKADIRLIPFVFLFILANAEPFSKKWQRISFVLLTAILSIIIFVHVSHHLIKLDDEIKNEYLSGVEYIQKNKKLFPLQVGKDRYNEINPYAHLFNYYGIYAGSITGYNLAINNTISPLWYKAYKEFPDFKELPRVGKDELNDKNIKLIKSKYDYVLMWGKDKKIENMFLDHGLRLIFENKRLHIFETDLLNKTLDDSLRHVSSEGQA